MRGARYRVTVAAGIAVFALGVWGLVIDEPYWRAVGHGPSEFTWATWAAIVLSGPAWLVARPAAWAVVSQPELQFILEHVLWAGLAALSGRWCSDRPLRSDPPGPGRSVRWSCPEAAACSR